jgi:hypothetical protein
MTNPNTTMTYTTEILGEIIRLNALWLVGDPTGKRAGLRGANLSGAEVPNRHWLT